MVGMSVWLQVVARSLHHHGRKYDCASAIRSERRHGACKVAWMDVVDAKDRIDGSIAGHDAALHP